VGPRRGVAAVALAALLAGAATALAAPSGTITVRDPRGDARTNLDLQRASLKRTGRGGLQASMTFAAAVRPRDLRAPADGPPGSLCLRVWSDLEADPAATAPDRLVCVTEARGNRLRGSVLRERPNATPERVGSARVARPSARSVRIDFAQSDLGSPARFRVAFETSRAGCFGASCVDRAPNGAGTRIYRLR
jgi:hypothetical protein